MGMFTETDVGDIIIVNETNSTLIITTKEKHLFQNNSYENRNDYFIPFYLNP